MTINFKMMPDKVVNVSGPLIEFDKPVQVREIGKFLADENHQHYASSLHEVKFIQLSFRRDGNYFLEPVFYLTGVGGENQDRLCGFIMGIFDRCPR